MKSAVFHIIYFCLLCVFVRIYTSGMVGRIAGPQWCLIPEPRLCESGGSPRQGEWLMQMEPSLWVSCKVSASWPKTPVCDSSLNQGWFQNWLTALTLDFLKRTATKNFDPFGWPCCFFFNFNFFFHSYARGLYLVVSWGKDFLRCFWQGLLLEETLCNSASTRSLPQASRCKIRAYNCQNLLFGASLAVRQASQRCWPTLPLRRWAIPRREMGSGRSLHFLPVETLAYPSTVKD